MQEAYWEQQSIVELYKFNGVIHQVLQEFQVDTLGVDQILFLKIIIQRQQIQHLVGIQVMHKTIFRVFLTVDLL